MGGDRSSQEGAGISYYSGEGIRKSRGRLSDAMNLHLSLAEGARFELADPLRGLQFSRLARSATPSPLHTMRDPTLSQYDGSWRWDNVLEYLILS